MPITLSKAIEIVELNLKVAGKSMPPDCRDAIQLGLESMKQRQHNRLVDNHPDQALLPGEAPEQQRLLPPD